jgi:hypothetical protein
MSLIAAAQEDIDAGKHSALPDKLFLLTLDDSIVPAQEKKDIKDQLLDGIKTNSKHFKTCCHFYKTKTTLPPPFKPQISNNGVAKTVPTVTATPPSMVVLSAPLMLRPHCFFLWHIYCIGPRCSGTKPCTPLFLALTHCCLFPSFHRHEHFLPTLRRYIGMDPGHNTVDHHGRSK